MDDAFDLAEAVISRRSRTGIEALATWVGGDPVRFDEAWSIMQSGPRRASECAAWLVDKCLVRWPDLLIPYQAAALDMLRINYHQAVHRCLAKHLGSISIDESLRIPLLEYCFEAVPNRSAPIAIRAHCMSVAWAISAREPALRESLGDLLRSVQVDASPGIRSRSRKILRKIESS